MKHSDYIVIRPAADLPDGFLPKHWDGRWYNRDDFPAASIAADLPDAPPRPFGPGIVAVPTGNFETREDGAVAEVWEVRP